MSAMAKKPTSTPQPEPDPNIIRDRVVGSKKVKASDLVPHPLNWRTHGDGQRGVMDSVLREIGFAGSILTYTLPDGRYCIIDGHLRQEQVGDMPVTILETDLTEDEAAVVLATFDPIGAMAGADKDKLDELLRGVNTDEAALQAMLAQLAQDTGIMPPDFQPVGIDEQPRLDQKNPIVCPHCGQEFIPQ